MKKRNVFLLLLLSIIIILGNIQIFRGIKDYFSEDVVFGQTNKLEIEYWMDTSAEEISESQSSESMLAKLRNEKVEFHDSSKIHEEERENINSNATDSKERRSPWEKLLESKEKRKKNEASIQDLVLEKAKEDKIKEDKINEEKNKKEEETINKFQEEIRKLSQNTKKGPEENNKDQEENKNVEEKATEEQKKATKKAKKVKEKKEREQKEKRKKENIVTMQIRCDTAVAKGMADNPEWQGIVPKSGIILANTEFRIKEGDTVLDVLLMAKEQYKFHVSYRGEGGSAYVEGINNLYEFDGGRWSGWMYCVNGWYPNYGAGAYVLKGGDVIEWNYTCNLGKDLGQEWIGD